MPKPRITVDEARLLPRYRQPGVNTPATTQAHGSTDTSPATSTHTGTTATASAAELRGIPAIGRGVSGAINHTHPEQETIYRLTPREWRAA